MEQMECRQKKVVGIPPSWESMSAMGRLTIPPTGRGSEVTNGSKIHVRQVQ